MRGRARQVRPSLACLLERSDAPAPAGASVLRIDRYPPQFLLEQSAAHHASLVCEGSLFTSTFSDVLSATLLAALGCARGLGLPGIGYGSDAGSMSERLRAFAARACADSLVLCRSRSAQERLQGLGLRTFAGADPAWSHEPERGRAPAGEGTRNAVICPVNPYWWPVKIDLPKAFALSREPSSRELHYGGVYFHSWSAQAEASYERYLASLAGAAHALRKSGLSIVIAGMERLDAACCRRLAEKIGGAVPVLVSAEHPAAAIVELLRGAALVVTSRFHGAVLAMCGEAPTIAFSLDNRLEDLFGEHGLGQWSIDIGSADAGEKLCERIAAAGAEKEALKARYRSLRARQLRALGEMGRRLHAEVAKTYAELEGDEGVSDWRRCLPPLAGPLNALLEAES
jgi:polysaccharide pyruvyl transferase WcaK-like protein